MSKIEEDEWAINALSFIRNHLSSHLSMNCYAAPEEVAKDFNRFHNTLKVLSTDEEDLFKFLAVYSTDPSELEFLYIFSRDINSKSVDDKQKLKLLSQLMQSRNPYYRLLIGLINQQTIRAPFLALKQTVAKNLDFRQWSDNQSKEEDTASNPNSNKLKEKNADKKNNSKKTNLIKDGVVKKVEKKVEKGQMTGDEFNPLPENKSPRLSKYKGFGKQKDQKMDKARRPKITIDIQSGQEINALSAKIDSLCPLDSIEKNIDSPKQSISSPRWNAAQKRENRPSVMPLSNHKTMIYNMAPERVIRLIEQDKINALDNNDNEIDEMDLELAKLSGVPNLSHESAENSSGGSSNTILKGFKESTSNEPIILKESSVDNQVLGAHLPSDQVAMSPTTRTENNDLYTDPTSNDNAMHSNKMPPNESLIQSRLLILKPEIPMDARRISDVSNTIDILKQQFLNDKMRFLKGYHSMILSESLLFNQINIPLIPPEGRLKECKKYLDYLSGCMSSPIDIKLCVSKTNSVENSKGTPHLKLISPHCLKVTYIMAISGVIDCTPLSLTQIGFPKAKEMDNWAIKFKFDYYIFTNPEALAEYYKTKKVVNDCHFLITGFKFRIIAIIIDNLESTSTPLFRQTYGRCVALEKATVKAHIVSKREIVVPVPLGFKNIYGSNSDFLIKQLTLSSDQ